MSTDPNSLRNFIHTLLTQSLTGLIRAQVKHGTDENEHTLFGLYWNFGRDIGASA